MSQEEYQRSQYHYEKYNSRKLSDASVLGEDAYKFYKNEGREENPVSQKAYNLIVREYAKFLVEQLLEGHVTHLPGKMGSMGIFGKKKSPEVDEKGYVIAPVNWAKTLNLWREKPELRGKKMFYHTNPHTNGYVYRVTWIKENASAINKVYYIFRPTTNFRKRLASMLLNGATQFGIRDVVTGEVE